MLQQLLFIRHFHALERETHAALRAQLRAPNPVPATAPIRRQVSAAAVPWGPVCAPRYPPRSAETGVSHSVSPSKRTASSGA